MADESKRKKRDATSKAEKPAEPPKKTFVDVKEADKEKSEEVKVDAEAFQIVFYMKHFRVTDILVKVVDRTLIIDACHREYADEHGLVTRCMVRKQKLPQNVKVESLVSSFTSHGFLVIHAEWLDKKTEK